MVKLTFKDIKPGLKVFDDENTVGIVKECDDPHNIFVEFPGEGSGLYCLVDNCIEGEGSRDLYLFEEKGEIK